MELLIALGILSLLFVAIIGMTSSTIGFARMTSSINDAAADLSDAMGYVGLKTRGAFRILGGATTIDVAATGYGTFTCDEAAASPCFAIVSPIVDRASSDAAITGYELLAYRFMPLDEWAGDPGLTLGWNAGDTPLLLEFRAPLACGSPCSGNPVVPATATSDRVSLVIADLTFEGAGGTFSPIDVDGNGVTLQFRRRGSGSEADRFVPADGPLVQVVTRRQ